MTEPKEKLSVPVTIEPETGSEYRPPRVNLVPTFKIDRQTKCACKEWDDNPWQ